MKVQRVRLWTFVFALLNTCSAYRFLGSKCYPYACQKWCLKVQNNVVFLDCCDCVNSVGKCPSSNVQTYDHNLDLRQLHCLGDMNCPNGFKCCKEANYGPYDICKQAIFIEIGEDATTTVSEVSISTTEGTPLTSADTISVTETDDSQSSGDDYSDEFYRDIDNDLDEDSEASVPTTESTPLTNTETDDSQSSGDDYPEEFEFYDIDLELDLEDQETTTHHETQATVNVPDEYTSGSGFSGSGNDIIYDDDDDDDDGGDDDEDPWVKEYSGSGSGDTGRTWTDENAKIDDKNTDDDFTFTQGFGKENAVSSMFKTVKNNDTNSQIDDGKSQ